MPRPKKSKKIVVTIRHPHVAAESANGSPKSEETFENASAVSTTITGVLQIHRGGAVIAEFQDWKFWRFVD